MIRLIVGLGNPGKQYKNTRHNLGFMVIEELKQQIPTAACSSKFEAEVCEAHEPHKFFILTSSTLMNDSGKPVAGFANYYKITAGETLVIYDDVDLPVGNLRLSEGGSSGHQGVQSVISNLGNNFWRLRIGIGDNRQLNVPSEDYVLQDFKPEEKKVIEKSVTKSVEIIKLLLENKIDQIKSEIAEFNK